MSDRGELGECINEKNIYYYWRAIRGQTSI